MGDRSFIPPERSGASDDSFDRLIRAAFEGQELSLPAHPASVVATLRELTGAEPSVELGGAACDSRGHESGPGLLETRPSAEGRYLISGEIGRGGIGVVLRGRDTDLGRDVALKVLRSRHARDPVLVTSFLEEAQVGGQLQHPGIVPVYEMGLSKRGQPYFAMKLVEGETLATLLERRAHPGEGLARLLGVFAQVCQAVAYAHAQGVVHRDLKPANVMIGRFGEVQVVDWGLAKVLRAGGRSRDFGAGSGLVIGSPGYMSPEQARGDLERVDERSDVYALGAILREILTGHSPVEKWEHGIAADSGDEDLARLARSCLTPDPADRPRDAGEVAHRIDAHLAAVEERAQAARIRAAEAEIVATAERRTRRLVLGLAASVLATVAVGSGAYLRAESRRADRRERIREAAGAELVQAEVLRERANAAGDGESPAWSQARMAVERARAHLAAEDAPRDLRERAMELEAALDREESAAMERLRREREEEGLLEELDESRVRRWNPVYALSASQIAADYGELFRAHGLPLDDMTEQDAVARLSESAHRVELAGHVANWSFAQRELDPPDVRGAEHLLAVARAVDEDPVRDEICDAFLSGNVSALGDLAGRIGQLAVPPATVALLVHGLVAKFRLDEGIEVLRAAQRNEPDDFVINATLGTLLYSRRSDEEALGFLRAALATRPGSREVRLMLGETLLDLGHMDEAEPVLARLLEAEPDFALAHAALGKLYRRRGQPELALSAVGRAMELAPELSVIHRELGLTRWELGERDEALAALRETVRIDPGTAQHWDKLGEAAQQAGKGAEALEAFKKALEIGPDSSPRRNNLGVALIGLGRIDEAVAAYREAIALDPTNPYPHKNLGVALQRLGDHGAASESFREATRIEPRNAKYQAALGASLGMAGDFTGAEVAVREALRLDPGQSSSHANLAQLLLIREHYADAVLHLRRALELDDGFVVALGMLARIRANAPDDSVRDPQEAVDLAGRAVELAPAASDWHLDLGLALFRTGEWEASRDALAHALELESGDPELARFVMAMDTEQLGDHALAVELFALADGQARERGGGGQEVERAREEAAGMLGLDAADSDE